MQNIVRIDFIDYGAQGEYGWFGKKVASSWVAGWTAEAIDREIDAVVAEYGSHITPRLIEEVPSIVEERDIARECAATRGLIADMEADGLL